MKVSIITATYNSAKTIQSCLDSVLKQTYENIEYLIIDGKSKDETHAIVQKASDTHSHIKWISERDKGIYDALNKGIALATGDIIGFVHSDDFLSEPNIIAEIVKQFKREAVDGVYGDLQYVDKENTLRVVRAWKSKEFHLKLLQRGWMPAHPTLYLKKSVYEKHGEFNLNFKIAGDYDFMLRILKDTELKFSYLPKVITKMRLGGISNGSLRSIYKKSREDYKAIKLNGLLFPLSVLFRKNFSKIHQFIN